MLSFQNSKKKPGKLIANVYKKNKRGSKLIKSIYFHQKRDKELMNVIEDVEIHLNSPYFREKFDLSKADIKTLAYALEDEEPPEDSSLRKKYYKVLHEIERRSYKEIDLESTDEFISIDLPKTRNEYAYSFGIHSFSGSGKTYWLVSLILRNWSRPSAERRKVVYISAELALDTTLEPLRDNKYRNLFEGIDVSQENVNDWCENNSKSTEDFFKEQIEDVCNRQPKGTLICLDDIKDAHTALQRSLHNFQNRSLRTARHRGHSVATITHAIRGGHAQSQITSSVRWRVFFANSSKGKLVDYLRTDAGFGIRDARYMVERFQDGGRQLIHHLHTPQCLIGDKLVVLI